MPKLETRKRLLKDKERINDLITEGYGIKTVQEMLFPDIGYKLFYYHYSKWIVGNSASEVRTESLSPEGTSEAEREGNMTSMSERELSPDDAPLNFKTATTEQLEIMGRWESEKWNTYLERVTNETMPTALTARIAWTEKRTALHTEVIEQLKRLKQQ